jgi:hypothetical protein
VFAVGLVGLSTVPFELEDGDDIMGYRLIVQVDLELFGS